MKHVDRFQRVIRKILANQIQLVQNLRRHGDNVASRIVGLKNIQQFAGTGP